DAEECGRRGVARSVAALALAAAVRRDDTELAREARAVQARIGARSRRAGLSGAHHLTVRESQIAALVTQGLDNHEVARALHLSVRTVEGHVSRIYAKLGVASRSELAALLG
ncbi:response regulator transcription factor, partial [Actinotalea sp. JY-7885]